MNLAIKFFAIMIAHPLQCLCQDSTAVDSIKKILDIRYEELAKAMNSRDLERILSFRSDDFHAVGPDGRVLDHLIMKDYSDQFISNNAPPYNIKNTILNLRLSYYKIVAVADILQEVTRTREILGKERLVTTSVEQTETWVFEGGIWKLKSVDNVHNQKRFVDGKRVDPSKPFNPDDPPYDPDKKD